MSEESSLGELGCLLLGLLQAVVMCKLELQSCLKAHLGKEQPFQSFAVDGKIQFPNDLRVAVSPLLLSRETTQFLLLNKQGVNYITFAIHKCKPYIISILSGGSDV